MDDMLSRMWDDLGSRLTGPLSFRLILQPAMALFFGIRDGVKDARNKRSPYSWSLLTAIRARPSSWPSSSPCSSTC